MVSICTGAFALAAAGVLDGRRATTHWRDAADLAARYPRVSVEPGVLYVDEGDVLTSARRRLRASTSACTSCAATTAPRWPAGSPAGSSSRPTATAARPSSSTQPLPEPRGGSLAATRAWALERLHEPLTVRALAAHAHVSERTLRPPLRRRDRRCPSCSGCSPSASTPPAPRWSPPTRSIDEIARPLRLRHRREPAQALPPPRRDDADGLPALPFSARAAAAGRTTARRAAARSTAGNANTAAARRRGSR